MNLVSIVVESPNLVSKINRNSKVIPEITNLDINSSKTI
jgi:hypothetical protein